MGMPRAGKNDDVEEGKAVELEECQSVPGAVVVEQGNGAVLLDVGHVKEQSGRTNLKLTRDGHTVLVPQPTDDPNDPLNWSDLKKNLLLLAISLAAFQSDYQTAAGVPSVGLQGVEWHLSPVHVNYAGNLNVLMKYVFAAFPVKPIDPLEKAGLTVFFLSGIGGLVWIPLIYLWGRAPVLFWTSFIGTFLTLATCLVPNFAGYYGLRALMGVFLSSGPAVGLAFIQDVFFLHEQARKIGIWIFAVQVCPYCSPMFGSYIIAATGSWRATFWVVFGLEALVLLCLALFLDESFYRRDLPPSQQPQRGTRILRLVGWWQLQVHRRYFASFTSSFLRVFEILLKPIIIPLLAFYSSAILFAEPVSAGGYGMSLNSTGYLYFAPIIAVLIGETLGHFINDWTTTRYVRQHNGVFKPEARLPPVYLTLLLTVPGLILVGQALERHLSWVAVAFGWAMYTAAVMMFSVPLFAYALDSYRNAPGEVSAWFNFARIIGGFSVGYFQQGWGLRSGFDVSFGVQAAIVASGGLIILALQIYGEKLRARGGVLRD
ncbi:MFS transporter [Fonsecaea pedrosoi]|nr:MFS transporter [Fonsecaea pedrosoi]